MSDSIAVSTFLLQLGSTLAMVGLIWFVQIVHYPLYVAIGANEFPAFERQHVTRTGWVVVPLMLSELGTSVLMLIIRSPAIPTWTVWLGLVLLGIIWLSTAIYQVPCHHILSSHCNAEAQQQLVATNWIRTLAWSGRGVLVLFMTWLLLA